MCQAPVNIPEKGFVACHNCNLCRANRVNDLVGRCIAEQENSSQTLAITLTYAGDVPSAATLVYADFQKFMKRLRRAGYSVRYIVAGEYGTKRGRAHWHAVLFFSGKAPKIVSHKRYVKSDELVFDTMMDWPHWGLGGVFVQKPSYEGLRYVLKYVLKETESGAHSHLAMSKRPPLGHEFFQRRAQEYVDNQIAPRDFFYTFSQHMDANHKRRKFYLRGVSRDNFLEAFFTKWEETHETEHPLSELITEYLLSQDVDVTVEERPYSPLDEACVYVDFLEQLPARGVFVEWVRDTIGTMSGIPCRIRQVSNGRFIVDYGRDKQWHVNGDQQRKYLLDRLRVETVRERYRLQELSGPALRQSGQHPAVEQAMLRSSPKSEIPF